MDRRTKRRHRPSPPPPPPSNAPRSGSAGGGTSRRAADAPGARGGRQASQTARKSQSLIVFVGNKASEPPRMRVWPKCVIGANGNGADFYKPPRLVLLDNERFWPRCPTKELVAPPPPPPQGCHADTLLQKWINRRGDDLAPYYFGKSAFVKMYGAKCNRQVNNQPGAAENMRGCAAARNADECHAGRELYCRWDENKCVAREDTFCTHLDASGCTVPGKLWTADMVAFLDLLYKLDMRLHLAAAIKWDISAPTTDAFQRIYGMMEYSAGADSPDMAKTCYLGLAEKIEATPVMMNQVRFLRERTDVLKLCDFSDPSFAHVKYVEVALIMYEAMRDTYLGVAATTMRQRIFTVPDAQLQGHIEHTFRACCGGDAAVWSPVDFVPAIPDEKGRATDSPLKIAAKAAVKAAVAASPAVAAVAKANAGAAAARAAAQAAERAAPYRNYAAAAAAAAATAAAAAAVPLRGGFFGLLAGSWQVTKGGMSLLASLAVFVKDAVAGMSWRAGAMVLAGLNWVSRNIESICVVLMVLVVYVLYVSEVDTFAHVGSLFKAFGISSRDFGAYTGVVSNFTVFARKFICFVHPYVYGIQRMLSVWDVAKQFIWTAPAPDPPGAQPDAAPPAPSLRATMLRHGTIFVARTIHSLAMTHLIKCDKYAIGYGAEKPQEDWSTWVPLVNRKAAGDGDPPPRLFKLDRTTAENIQLESAHSARLRSVLFGASEHSEFIGLSKFIKSGNVLLYMDFVRYLFGAGSGGGADAATLAKFAEFSAIYTQLQIMLMQLFYGPYQMDNETVTFAYYLAHTFSHTVKVGPVAAVGALFANIDLATVFVHDPTGVRYVAGLGLTALGSAANVYPAAVTFVSAKVASAANFLADAGGPDALLRIKNSMYVLCLSTGLMLFVA